MSSKNRSRNNLILLRTKTHITKSEISMRTWRSPMSAASQGAFVMIPEISHSDISYIIRTATFQRLFFTLMKRLDCKRFKALSTYLREIVYN